MAFAPEDGTGLAGANSFVAVDDADSYFVDRNDSEWALLDQAVKEAALLDASSYLDALYDWPGSILVDTQGLSWPRYDAYDSSGRQLNGIPAKIVEATCYLAKESISAPLAASYDNALRVKKKVLGPLETEYADSTSLSPGRKYPRLEIILRGIIRSSQNNFKLVRA